MYYWTSPDIGTTPSVCALDIMCVLPHLLVIVASSLIVLFIQAVALSSLIVLCKLGLIVLCRLWHH